MEDEESAARAVDRKNKKSEVILQVFICLRRAHTVAGRCFVGFVVVVVAAVLLVVDFSLCCVLHTRCALIRSIRSLGTV